MGGAVQQVRGNAVTPEPVAEQPVPAPGSGAEGAVMHARTEDHAKGEPGRVRGIKSRRRAQATGALAEPTGPSSDAVAAMQVRILPRPFSCVFKRRAAQLLE